MYILKINWTQRIMTSRILVLPFFLKVDNPHFVSLSRNQVAEMKFPLWMKKNGVYAYGDGLE